MRGFFVAFLCLVVLLVSGCNDPGSGPDDVVDGSPAARDGGTTFRPTDGGARPPLPHRDAGPVDPSCGLDGPALCETFDAPHPGGYAGDLDETRWSFARWSGSGTGFSRQVAASLRPSGEGWSNPDGPPVLCGELFDDLLPPDDAVICDGQFSDVMQGNGLAINSFMSRQPFDFTDRTGTIVFDVDAKRNDGFDGHGWWLEVWITDEPVPMPYHEAPTVQSIPRNGIGIQIAPFNDAFDADPQVNQLNGVNGLVVVRDGVLVRDTPFGGIEGPAFRVRDQFLNRFRIELSRDHIEIFTSHYDDPDHLLPGLRVDDIDLGFTVGYVHFQHVHYNPSKVPNCDCESGEGCPAAVQACVEAGAPPADELACCWQHPDGVFASNTQVYRWDNIGFDGPVLPITRGYALPRFEYGAFEDDGMSIPTVELGFPAGGGTHALDIPNVMLTDALYATLNFVSWNSQDTLRVRANGHPFHTAVTNPRNGLDLGAHTYAVEVPLEELVAGTNHVEIETEESIGNVELVIYPSR